MTNEIVMYGATHESIKEATDAALAGHTVTVLDYMSAEEMRRLGEEQSRIWAEDLKRWNEEKIV